MPDAHTRLRDGMVTLQGQLEQRSGIPLAIRPRWRVDGVVGVVNNLSFLVDDSPPEQHTGGIAHLRPL